MSALLLGACASAATAAESPGIQQLRDPATGMRAYYALSGLKKFYSFAEFSKEHAGFQVIRCPQPGTASALHVVAHNAKGRSSPHLYGDYEVLRPHELFRRRPAGNGPHRMMDQALDGYHDDGRHVALAGLDDGYLFDFNGDGLVEKLDIEHSRPDDNTTLELLQVETMESQPRTLLAVVLNWHPDDDDTRENRWDWDIRQGAGKAWEIVLFPATCSPAMPEAVYEWDAGQKRLTGPDGGKGAHFARLPVDRLTLHEALTKLRDQGGLGYPVKGAPAVPMVDAGPGQGPPVFAPPTARPYVKQSRQKLTHAEMFAFMGPGRGWYDHVRSLALHDRVPEEFWNLPPRDAALELVDLNRSDMHRRNFQMALEDRDGQKPPETGTLHLSHSSSACYNARHWEIFLSFQPGDSWLACARTVQNGAASYNALHDGVHHDFEWHELKDTDARHLAQTIWWLDRVRTRERDRGRGSMSMAMSTADGHAMLKLCVATGAKPLVELNDEVFANEVTQRWRDGYNKQAALNFACLLIEQELPPRWGGSRDFLHAGLPVLRGQGDTPPDPTATDARRQGARMMLERFMQRLDQQPSLPPVFLQHALMAAAETGAPVEDVVKRLETLLRPPGKMENELRELETRLDKAGPRALLEPMIPDMNLGGRDPFNAKPSRESEEKRLARKQAEQRLDDDLRAHHLRQELEDDLSFMLRGTLPEVRRKMTTREDVNALKAWAAAHEPEAAWAMRRLRELDKAAYVEVLSTDLLKLTAAAEASQAVALFQEICQADTAAASRVLAQMKGDPGKACAAIAPPEVSIGEKDTGRMIKMMSDEKTAHSDRLALIDMLVPPDEPMRHRDPRIDEALLKEMEEQAGQFASTGRAAAEALARREGAIRHWDAFKHFYDKEMGLYPNAHDFLCRLVLESGDAQKLAELRAILLPCLQRSKSALAPVFASLYVANLHDAASDLERVATFDATDVEGAKVLSASTQEEPIKDRFHMARQILAVWDEPDATTTARMLIAWSIHHDGHRGLFRDKVQRQAQAALAAPGIDHAAVRGFLDWCLRSADASLDSPMSSATRQMLASWRKSLP